MNVKTITLLVLALSLLTLGATAAPVSANECQSELGTVEPDCSGDDDDDGGGGGGGGCLCPVSVEDGDTTTGL